ncbi:hypothetical protein HPB50_025919 [Hyalomma asiaticum]|uniref:Uncharacterized protein n=1 Tax=Hyalomma asiaticum TaxID=266040 RepID=A0ACB7T9X4_HYAAI|nr:hypothetical protein HPB50_025919 [Hyalomma asiaticum]
MASEQAHSRPSFLLDPLATDLLSFDEDDTDSTRYDRLCAPLQSATRSDPFLGPPYGDEPSEWHHSPSLANFRLRRLLRQQCLRHARRASRRQTPRRTDMASSRTPHPWT